MSKTDLLNEKLNAARELLVSDVYTHYKGGIYEIDGLVIDTDDGAVRVLYHRIGGPDYDEDAEFGIQFVRPLSEWFSDVNGEPRFKVK